MKFRERVILDANLGGHKVEVGDVDRDGEIAPLSASIPFSASDGEKVAGGRMR